MDQFKPEQLKIAFPIFSSHSPDGIALGFAQAVLFPLRFQVQAGEVRLDAREADPGRAVLPDWGRTGDSRAPAFKT